MVKAYESFGRWERLFGFGLRNHRVSPLARDIARPSCSLFGVATADRLVCTTTWHRFYAKCPSCCNPPIFLGLGPALHPVAGVEQEVLMKMMDEQAADHPYVSSFLLARMTLRHLQMFEYCLGMGMAEITTADFGRDGTGQICWGHAEVKECVLVEEGSVPVEEESVEEKSVSVEEESVPVEQKSVSVEQESVSAKEGSVPVEEESVPVEEWSVSMDEEYVPVEEEYVSIDKWSIPVEEKSVEEKSVSVEESVSAKEESMPVDKEETVSGEKGSVLVEEESEPVKKESVFVEEESVFVEEESEPVKEECVFVVEGSMPVEEGSVLVEEESMPVKKEFMPVDKCGGEEWRRDWGRKLENPEETIKEPEEHAKSLHSVESGIKPADLRYWQRD
ncbi:hypothetical protein QTP70_011013 [Hemibagrus guttatus]|uniref:Uncharacterized protein n=1 Tax=Hemibagrus guttatus TaxID=175788 RepID=A0AAE0UQR2_9TELE|nr:hypothetical protein QTP70_011013 [Hemibagrus guttatus]